MRAKARITGSMMSVVAAGLDLPNHWWEKNPHLSTAYAVLTLGLLWSEL